MWLVLQGFVYIKWVYYVEIALNSIWWLLAKCGVCSRSLLLPRSLRPSPLRSFVGLCGTFSWALRFTTGSGQYMNTSWLYVFMLSLTFGCLAAGFYSTQLTFLWCMECLTVVQPARSLKVRWRRGSLFKTSVHLKDMKNSLVWRCCIVVILWILW
jgi:hypothetical protein